MKNSFMSQTQNTWKLGKDLSHGKDYIINLIWLGTESWYGKSLGI